MLKIAGAALVAVVVAGLSGGVSVTPAMAAKGCRALTFHDEVRVGGVCCFSDHDHSGSSGPGYKSKQAAMSAAAESWASFVDFEYGGAYASFRRARGKSFSCSQGNGWSCTVIATPCH